MTGNTSTKSNQRIINYSLVRIFVILCKLRQEISLKVYGTQSSASRNSLYHGKQGNNAGSILKYLSSLIPTYLLINNKERSLISTR